MRIISAIFIFVLAFFYQIKNVYSQVTEQKSNERAIVCATSYPDYKPLSYTYTKNHNDIFYNVFENYMKNILMENNLVISLETNKTYKENVHQTIRGKCDLLLGMYNETQNKIKEFEQIEYIFPAVLNNPINLIMLPDNVSKIKNFDDLKKLKGVYISKEYFSDYIYEVLSNYGIEPEEDVKKAYEKLFLGEIDFIVGSYYYHYIQSVQLGLKDYISFSKKSLWKIPMFIGVSQRSKHYKRLKLLLAKKFINSSTSEIIEEEIKNVIKEIETNNIGIVPPSFVLQQDSNVLTPADEIK